MAGGTGGHIFPALAIAKELTNQGANIEWLGGRNSMEGLTGAKTWLSTPLCTYQWLKREKSPNTFESFFLTMSWFN